MASSDADAALAAMATQGRTPMGKDGIKFTDGSSAGTGRATLVPKKGAQAADLSGGKADRVPVMRDADSERKGATYGIVAGLHKPTDPAAGMTQANGRIISSATNRDRGNFDGGAEASYK